MHFSTFIPNKRLLHAKWAGEEVISLIYKSVRKMKLQESQVTMRIMQKEKFDKKNNTKLGPKVHVNLCVQKRSSR